MRYTSLFSMALVGLTVVATGCKTFDSTSRKSPSTKQATEAPATRPAAQKTPAVNPHALDGLLGEWSITEVAGKTVVVNGENHPKITFAQAPGSADMLRVIGYNGCNYINGDWKVNNGKITPAGEFISTLMACPDAPYEYDVNQAIDRVASYKLTDPENLVLLSASGTPVMKLRSRNLSFLDGAWSVVSIYDNPVPASADVRVVLDIEERKIHGNAGCNVLNGELVVNLDKGNGLEFKNLATTRMTCPDIATEQQFLLALEEVDTAVRGADASTALMKDSSGKTIITLSRLSADKLADDDNGN